MKGTALVLALFLGWTLAALPAAGQKSTDKKNPKPKNEITKLEQARKRDRTVRQVTPDPKKSPGKHADNLSKNVNREINRESKDVNRGVNQGSKAVNHSLNQFSKDVNRAFQGKKKSDKAKAQEKTATGKEKK